MTDMKVVIVPKKGEAEGAKPMALKPYVPKKFGGAGFKNEKKHLKKTLKKQMKEDFFARNKLIKSIVKNATRESVIKVDTDSKGVVTKADAVPRMIASERSMARSVVGMKPYRTVLCQQFNVVTGSTNTTYAPVFPADVTLANNWQDWVDLFDEVRIIKTELISSQFVAAAGTAVVNYAAVWGVSCDLEDASAETSIQNQIVAPYHAGPFSQCNVGISGVLSGSGAAAASTFGSFQPGGLLHLHSPKLPMNTLPVNSGGSTAANPVNGNWAPVTSASIVGNWFKYYVEPSGVGISFNIRPFIAYEVEFRLRG